MARIKLRPRLAQPDPEPRGISPAAQAIGKALNALKEFRSRNKQRRNDDDSQNTDNQVPPKSVIPRETERPRSTEDRSVAEQPLNIGQSFAITDLECPNCGSKFPDMGIKVSRFFANIITLTLLVYSIIINSTLDICRTQTNIT